MTLHGVLAGVAGIGEGLDLLDASPGWSLSDEQARAALVEVTRLSARTRAAYLRLLADCARRDTPATGKKDRTQGQDSTPRRVETTAWLAEQARMSTGRVRSDLTEANAPDVHTGALRTVGADLAAGVVTAEHASITVRALAQVPAADRAIRRLDIDTQLAGNARTFTPPVTQLLAAHLLATIDPDRTKGFDVDADQRRQPYLATDATGMVLIRGQLEPASDARTGDGGRGDGAAFGVPAGVPAGAASCEATGPLSPGTLARLACDAVIERVLLSTGGRVLEMTSLGRLFTPAQRRALAARDGGCAFPGCDRPPSWRDAHHIIFWTDGGPTTVGNGVLLCGQHHSTIHHGLWTIVMRDGVPWFIPPPHLDPRQRPLRNTVHDAVTDNRRAGQQLHLDLPLDERPDEPDPPDVRPGQRREPAPDDG